MGKDTYRVRNWKQYNEGLKRRGSLHIWISTDAFDPIPPGTALRRGRPHRYSNTLLLTCLTVRQVYHLPLRACQGFLQSLSHLLHLRTPIPDYTTLCRRAATLQVDLAPLQQKGICDVAIDATGLKVYGEGEWKVRRHGFSKRRTWRKLHVVVNPGSGQVEAMALTPNSTDDGQVAAPLAEAVLRQHPIDRLLGDGAYDKLKVRKPLHGRVGRLVFPPSVRAVKSKSKDEWQVARNEVLDQLEAKGRKAWKEAVGYHRRSAAETCMFRYKTLIGEKLKARRADNQGTEARIGCRLLNQLLQVAKPQSLKVA